MSRKPDSAVAHYIADLPDELAHIASTVQRIVLAAATGITGELKWGMPWFFSNGPICYLMANQKHVTFGFARGASLTDPGRVLQGTGKSMRHVKLRTRDDIHPRQFTQWVREAIQLNARQPASPRPRPRAVARPAGARAARC